MQTDRRIDRHTETGRLTNGQTGRKTESQTQTKWQAVIRHMDRKTITN